MFTIARGKYHRYAYAKRGFGSSQEEKMYKKIIDMLMENQVIFEVGLDASEIGAIESYYCIQFPDDLKEFFKCGLPVSEGFYNWRDFSEKNVNKIKSALMAPILNIRENIDDLEWFKNWGAIPDNKEQKNSIIIQKLETAPILIPLFKHRYISSQFKKDNPIFSIYDLDIIYYGENLEQYFLVEFKYKKHSEITYQKIKRVTFWSDLLE